MKRLMLIGLLVFGANVQAVELPASTHWDCSMNGRGNRIFDLVYHVPGKNVPCQVNYRTTESPDEIQVLWQADVERNYCEKMLFKRVEELKSQHWKCDPRS